MVQHFSTHTITQLTRARGSHKGNCLRRQVGRTLTGGYGGEDEPSPRRCDAMPMRHAGATRYFAFYGVHSGIGTGLSTFWIFCFCFSRPVFPFPVLSVFLSRFGQSQKRARTSITCIHHHHYHHHTGKGLGWGGEGLEQPVLIFGHLGEISGTFSPPLRAGFLYSSLVVVFLRLRYLTPLFFSSPAGPPPTRSRGPGFPFPPPFIPPCQTRSRTRRDERRGKGWYFHPSGSGGTGGLKGAGVCEYGIVGRGTSLQEKGNPTPFLLQDKTFCRNFNVGMGVRRRRRRRLAWTGRTGGYLHGSGVKGRSSRCLLATNKKYQPNWVCLSLAIPRSTRVGRDGTTQDQVREKKKQRETAKPNIITPNR